MIGVFAQIVYIFLYQDRDSQSVGEFLIEPEKLELSGSATSVKAYGAAPVSETEAPKSENKIWTRAETLKESKNKLLLKFANLIINKTFNRFALRI